MVTPATPVIPTDWTSSRQDLNAALEALIQAFIASTDYAVVRKFWSELPQSVTGEGPAAILTEVTEAITHDQGTRNTLFEGRLVYIDFITDPVEVNARINLWADRMRDLFTANARILAPYMLEQTGFQEGELEQGMVRVQAPYITFRMVVLEGRS